MWYVIYYLKLSTDHNSFTAISYFVPKNFIKSICFNLQHKECMVSNRKLEGFMVVFGCESNLVNCKFRS